MPKLTFTGPWHLRLRSLATLARISIATQIAHARGHRMAPDWDATMETGIRFVRHQFTAAMTGGDIARGRLRFDSLQPETDDRYAVSTQRATGITGRWVIPDTARSQAVLLYFHGGGYTFHGGVSHRYADMLCHHSGARLLAVDYRLTPEHPHPAQAEDALAAWTALTATVPPERIVVIGDSAGGHMALMLLQRLKARGLRQPALCIGLCPWTDIGARGASLRDNDATDLVQGWMALQFGRWLDPDGHFGRAALSPIAQDYAGLAPLYLQAGGREVLRDMILDFAQRQAANGADVTCDLWPDMPHNFQAYDSTMASSRAALRRIVAAIDAAMGAGPPLQPLAGVTTVA